MEPSSLNDPGDCGHPSHPHDEDSIDPKYNKLQWRWHTEEQAKEMHELIVNCYHENKEPEEAIRKLK